MRRPTNTFAVHPGWKLLLADVGVRPEDLLRRAGLPGDLFARPSATLTTADFFHFWRVLDEQSDDPALAIRLGKAISLEAFDPAIFAALCSPDLDTALERISRFKPLFGPMALHIDRSTTSTRLEIEFLDKSEPPPSLLVSLELVFFVQLARLATREEIRPIALESPDPPDAMEPFAEYFGRPVRSGPAEVVTFSAVDAQRPFLTANEAMWDFFEPELRKRLSELDESATVTDRVRAALLELLPSGGSSLREVAKRLAVSTRTLQRRLRSEGRSFQQVLDATREDLARHYLSSSRMSGAEISYLLGFEDPNSFFRAFHAWTGQTPEQARLASAAR